jgi:hypothetical protein
MHAGDAIPEDLLDETVVGVNLVPGRLRDQLDSGPTLLVFLRHLGCIFCREQVTRLREASERDARFPPVLFFFQGTSTEGRVFLSRYWPKARAIADRPLRFYGAFGIERGSFRQTLGPAVWKARRRALQAGFEQGERSGDVWMMPGVLWVEAGRVRWRHAYGHAGDAPDYASLPEAMAALPQAGRGRESGDGTPI